ncbi:MAG: flagellar biosynthetic protein FliR [Gammaproteobacteria bacterium]
MHFTETELMGMLALFLWPFLRIGSMFVTVPIFNIPSVPARVRIILAFAVTLLVMPFVSTPETEIFSLAGAMVAVQQIAIGMTTGFIIQMVFAAAVFGGQGIAYSMGLGFASLVDPQTGIQVPVVAQFYVVTASLLFLVMDGHLLLVEMLLDSFRTIPVAADGLAASDFRTLVSWGSRIFAGGLLLALPLIATLLLVNISFGVATRAAPQLNIFSVGFPVTLLLGLVFIWLTLPQVLDGFSGLLTEGYEIIGQLLRL